MCVRVGVRDRVRVWVRDRGLGLGLGLGLGFQLPMLVNEAGKERKVIPEHWGRALPPSVVRVSVSVSVSVSE